MSLILFILAIAEMIGGILMFVQSDNWAIKRPGAIFAFAGVAAFAILVF